MARFQPARGRFSMYSRQLSEGLADLARASEQKRDAALLRATTELFILDILHDSDEIHRYEELATHFLPKVSPGDRLFVAERLATCSDAPPAVIRMLARDTIEIAAPVLRHCTTLNTADLLAVIAATGAEHRRLIARRSSLSADVIKALRLTGDTDITGYLDTGDTARAAAPSPDTSARDKSAIYQSNRLDPWRFLELDRSARLRIIADIADHPPARPYASDGVKIDRAFRSILSAAQIVGYARGGQLGPIIATMSDGLNLPPDLVAAAASDTGGELFAIMLKALRLDDIQAQQVFLLASPSGRSVQTFFPLTDLYAGMEPYVAETIVLGWRDAMTAREPRHEPHLAENGDRRRAAVPEVARRTEQPAASRSRRA
jgi:hypothetical protein